MSKWTWLQAGIVVVAAAASLISFNLLKKHYGQPVSTWFDAACGDAEESGANCQKVIASEWGTLELTWGEAESKKTAKVPTALTGMIYFAVIGAWFVGVGRPSRERLWMHALPSLIVLGGCGFSVFLTYQMLTSEFRCNWCLATHLCNLLLLAGTALIWWSYRNQPPARPDGSGASGAAAPAAAAIPAHPAPRLVVMTVLAMLTLGLALLYFSGLYSANAALIRKEIEVRRYQSYVRDVQQDATTLMTNWELGKQYEFKVTDDTPVQILTDGPGMQMVVFSDFECPHCRRFAHFVHDFIQPLFANRMMVAYKNYPLNKRCNPRVQTAVHTHACWSGALALAARMQKGNDKFWEVHDYFYDNPAVLKEVTSENSEVRIRALAVQFGLDPDQVIADMQAKEMGASFLADIEEAAAAGVTSTPGVFVNGKRVNQLAVLQWPFWREMARLYWKTVGEDPPAEVIDLLKSLAPPKPERGDAGEAGDAAVNGGAE